MSSGEYVPYAGQPLHSGTCLGCQVRDADLYSLMQRFDEILGREIEQRRAEQDAKHGGQAHDDTHTPVEWIRFIHEFAFRAQYAWKESNDGSFGHLDLPAYEDKLLDVIALAISAIQSSRRKRGGLA